VAPQPIGSPCYVIRTKMVCEHMLVCCNIDIIQGVPDLKSTLVENLNQPLGMTLLDGYLYVGNTDGLVRFQYVDGATTLTRKPEKVLTLPMGGYNVSYLVVNDAWLKFMLTLSPSKNHWTRNVIRGREPGTLLVTVGSASNIAEHGMEEEHHRACMLEVDLRAPRDPVTGEAKVTVYASGIRNPVGLDVNPANGEIWTACNERDLLGDVCGWCSSVLGMGVL
jgi:glucose/arabinose dehydrogenase